MEVKNLDTGEMLEDRIENTIGSPVWDQVRPCSNKEGKSFFYTVVDDNWRPWQVRRHVFGATRRE